MSSQYKVAITTPVIRKIESYTFAIRDYYVALYTDTWLDEAEEVIQSQYIEWSDTLHRFIISSMKEIFLRELIPYTPLESWLRETSFRMGNRRIFLTYEENEEEQVRYIVDIEILRK